LGGEYNTADSAVREQENHNAADQNPIGRITIHITIGFPPRPTQRARTPAALAGYYCTMTGASLQ
jgi:hypothetical protein